jgi:salicylate hydroxylase
MQDGNQQENKTAVDVDDAEPSSRTDTRTCYTVCTHCKGEGKLSLGLTKKQKLRHKRAKNDAMNNGNETTTTVTTTAASITAQRRVLGCHVCQGSGVLESETDTEPPLDPRLPELAIIGGGIGGLALATACRHRGIPHTVYERDDHFSQRSQGYGLTMQQASKALAAFGIDIYRTGSDGITSTKHVVHRQDGTVVGEWGLRKWGRDATKDPKRQNIHIARQSLRYELLQTATVAGGCTESTRSSTSSGTATEDSNIQWNHRLLDYETCQDHVRMTFQVGDSDTVVERRADLIVGADGIRSAVRQALLGDDDTPLRYLDCIVILGICDVTALRALVPGDSGSSMTKEALELLDGETVFQTADGTTRIYMMPYSATEYMWQLSFPMNEQEASALSRQGPQALKDQAIARCQSWHTPVPQILRDTPASLVSGYPVYDRALLTAEMLDNKDASGFSRRVTLIGDASHPMSPFKGQGANQALLDALALARSLYQSLPSTTLTNHKHTPTNVTESEDGANVNGAEHTSSHAWKDALCRFEEEMLARSAVKVQASAEAAQFLHTDVAIQEGDVTRGVAAARANQKQEQEQ